MRLDTGENVIRSDEVIVRLVKGVDAEGVSMKRSPILVRPSEVNAFGIISALKTDDWGVPTGYTLGQIANSNFYRVHQGCLVWR